MGNISDNICNDLADTQPIDTQPIDYRLYEYLLQIDDNLSNIANAIDILETKLRVSPISNPRVAPGKLNMGLMEHAEVLSKTSAELVWWLLNNVNKL